jgi:hypothetical protein
MAEFEVVHQRYADSKYIRSIVTASSMDAAMNKVCPQFNEDEWAFCFADVLTEQEAEDWDIPFYAATGSSLI